jgi:hypothetical protein
MLDHMILTVSNVERSLAFYRRSWSVKLPRNRLRENLRARDIQHRDFLEPDFRGVWAAHFYGTGVSRQVDPEQANFRVARHSGTTAKKSVSWLDACTLLTN